MLQLLNAPELLAAATQLLLLLVLLLATSTLLGGNLDLETARSVDFFKLPLVEICTSNSRRASTMASTSLVSFRLSGDPCGVCACCCRISISVSVENTGASSGGACFLVEGGDRSAGGKFDSSCLGLAVCLLDRPVLGVSGSDGNSGSPNKSFDIISAEDSSADTACRTGGWFRRLGLRPCPSIGSSLDMAVVNVDVVISEVLLEDKFGPIPSGFAQWG